MSVQLMHHQAITANKWATHPDHICFDTSDPGTGKTIGTIAGFTRSPEQPIKKRLLVLAPLTILDASWLQDIEKFGGLNAEIAHGTPRKREKVMRDTNVDIVVTNHDAVRWISKDLSLVDNFTHLAIDESTAFKNSGTQRFQALVKMLSYFRYIKLLTGTPNPISVLDLWAQAFLLDQGKRLGNQFYAFRAAVTEPIQVGPDSKQTQWVDKEGAIDYVMDKLKDITVRFQLDEVDEIPPNYVRFVKLPMPDFIREAYQKLEAEAVLMTEQGLVKGINKGILVNKLLQLLSGAVYNEEGEPIRIHQERAALVMQLVEERSACLVAYNWKHELEALTDLADRMGISYGIINGSVKPAERTEVVKRFQEGKLRVIFAHPKAASHGLTLTRGEATIWASPTHSSELYQQFIKRIHRKGQRKKTETIRVAYTGSREIAVYKKLDSRLLNMDTLLSLFTDMTKLEKAS